MTPMLGDFSLDRWHARVSERQWAVRGRLARVVTVRGAADDFESGAALAQALDQLAGATATYAPVPLRLRPGRMLPVRLRAFTRETHPDIASSGAFTLELDALTPWEESEADQTQTAPVTGAGAAALLEPEGTLDMPLLLAFTASAPAMLPVFGDGAHTAAYSGVVPEGATLTLDGRLRRAWLDEEEATSQLSGDYLLVRPPATTITVDTGAGDPPEGALAMSWRNRWL